MVLKGTGLRARLTGSWHPLRKRWLKVVPSPQDGFSGIEDDADEALEISQAQLLHENRRKERQQQPKQPKQEQQPPSAPPALNLKTQTQSLPGQETASGETEAPPVGDDSSDSDSSSSEDEER